MELRVVKGKNFKDFVVVDNIKTKEDIELNEIIGKVVSRSEYMPFIQSFNKTISYSYLFNDMVFPAQFLQDVKKQLNALSSKPITVLNEEVLYQDFSREKFDEYVASLKLPEEIDMVSDEYKYQRDAVYGAIRNRLGRITVATSGGKTFITYLYLRYIFDNIIGEKKKYLIVVPTKLLAKQLKNDFAMYDKYMDRPFGVETIFTGAKKLLDADIVCGTFQSLSNYEQEYFDDFGVMVCDELHRAKAYSIRNEIFNKMLNCEFMFGMTGTMPKYNTLDYLHIVSMFGPEILTKKAYEIIDSGVATPVQVSMVKINYKNTEENNYSINLIDKGILGIDKYKMEKEFFQNHTKRTQIIGKLMNKLTDNSLILVDTVDYCYILFDLLCEYCPDWEFEIIHGEIKDRDEIIDTMRNTKEKFCIIGTFGTMSTGISIKNLVNCYFPDGGKAETKIGQSIGRIMRLFEGKKVARLIDLHDNIPRSSFKNHGKERLKYYNENKFPVDIISIDIEN